MIESLVKILLFGKMTKVFYTSEWLKKIKPIIKLLYHWSLPGKYIKEAAVKI